MSHIVVVGSLNIDLVINTPKIPVIGETVSGSGFMTTPGGKGANQAVAAARLGGNVSMIGCVGLDTFGIQLKDNLSRNGVDVSHVLSTGLAPTGVAVITVHKGNNFIILDSGANGELTPADIDEDVIAAADIIMVQLEIPIQTVHYAIETAYKHKVRVLLNPAPACLLPDELLAMVSVFTPNETECEIVTGKRIASVEDAKKVIPSLMAKGIANVIVTMGPNGAVYNDGNEIKHQEAPEAERVDTTAAGDCFSAALTVALCESMPISSAVEFACRAGSLAIQKKGAQESLPYRNEIK